MTKNPLTFKDIDPGQISSHPGVPISPLFRSNPTQADEVHSQGEVWCVTLWELHANLVGKYGWNTGNQLTLQLVIDGMKHTPPAPNFLQARDAIILADQVDNRGANAAAIWQAFAKRGMGASATAPDSSTTAGVQEAFDLPGLVFQGAAVSGGNGNGVIDFDECNNLAITLANLASGTASGVTARLSTTTPGVVIAQPLSAFPDIPGGATAVNTVPFTVSTAPDFVCGTPVVFTLLVKSSQDTRTNVFQLSTGTIGSPVRFDNNGAYPIPDNYPPGVSSPVAVSGIGGAIGKATVSLFITHTWDSNLRLELIAPDGTTCLLFSQQRQ